MGDLVEGPLFPQLQHDDFALLGGELVEGLLQLLAECLAVGIGAALEEVGGRLCRVVLPHLGATHPVDRRVVDHAQQVGALVFGMTILYETLIYGKSVPGYPSLVVGLMVLGGVQLIMIGVLGEYIGKILSEQKARPVYFVAEHQTRSEAGEQTDEDHRSGAAA